MHAVYGGAEAVVDIETLEVIEGRLPNRAYALVLEWASQHRDDLKRAWARAAAKEDPGTIKPLA